MALVICCVPWILLLRRFISRIDAIIYLFPKNPSPSRINILSQTRSHSVKNVADAKFERTSLSADVFQGSLQDTCPAQAWLFQAKQIQTQNDKLFYVTILISLHCKSEKELNDETEILESELSKKSSQLRTLSFKQLDGYKSVLPLNNLKVGGYDRNLTASGFSALFPIACPDLSHSKGIYLGTNLFTGSPVYLNSFII